MKQPETPMPAGSVAFFPPFTEASVNISFLNQTDGTSLCAVQQHLAHNINFWHWCNTWFYDRKRLQRTFTYTGFEAGNAQLE